MDEKANKHNHYVDKEEEKEVNLPSMQYLSGCKRKKKVIGRWSNEEHETFVQCLKTYGKDWDKLEEMIPTRSSVQIRSHLQKYFDRIKKEFGTNNPMQYIMRDMCDTSRVYKFDKSQINQAAESAEVQNFIGVYQDNSLATPRVTRSSQLNPKAEQGSECGRKKRQKKEKRKQLEDCNSDSLSNEKPLLKEGSSEYYSVKLFKIEKVARNGTESFSILNSNCDGQKNEGNQDGKEKKSQADLSECSSLNVKKGCSLVVLSKGEIVIQGNQIETSVPCKVEKLKNTVTAIIPTKTVRIIIEELNPSSCEGSESDKKNISIKGSKSSMKVRQTSTASKSQSTNKTGKISSSPKEPEMFSEKTILDILSNYCTCMEYE
ncbi:unnamed protein product [Moneuplotes crassus]|uniref:Uncharacterized protein n=1 Tax=Euplotes crassus TaxID=5936 RepID=A0AAD1ULF9_EUPCR|nr:unnamed protein product [Moneuplotes crassus]